MNLVTADAVFAVHDKPHRHEPFIESDGRFFHNGSSLRCELASVMGYAALPAIVLWQEHDLVTSAAWADDAIGPATRYQVVSAVVLAGEVNHCFLKGFRFLFHTSRIADWRRFLK